MKTRNSSLLQHLSRMVFSLHLLGRNDALHSAVLTDDEGGAERTEILPAVHALFAPRAERLVKRLLRVGYEVERQLVLLNEFGMRLLILYTHSQHLISC